MIKTWVNKTKMQKESKKADEKIRKQNCYFYVFLTCIIQKTITPQHLTSSR